VTKQQAIDFINAVNAVQPYVPPFLFNAVLNSEVSRLALVVANDAVICDVRAAHPPAPKGNGASEHADDGSLRP
jgi:hypothetical protein